MGERGARKPTWRCDPSHAIVSASCAERQNKRRRTELCEEDRLLRVWVQDGDYPFASVRRRSAFVSEDDEQMAQARAISRFICSRAIRRGKLPHRA